MQHSPSTALNHQRSQAKAQSLDATVAELQRVGVIGLIALSVLSALYLSLL